MLKLNFGKKKDAGDAAVPAVADGEAVEGATPAKKKLPLLFIIIPAALLVLGGGGGAAFFLMKPKPASADAGHAAPPPPPKKTKGGGEADPALGKISAGPDGATFYTLPVMMVNLQSSDGRPTVLKLTVTLETADPHVADSLMADAPRVKDMMQTFLRELRPEELAGSAASYQLRAEIQRRANLIAAPGKVDAVLIEEMLVH